MKVVQLVNTDKSTIEMIIGWFAKTGIFDLLKGGSPSFGITVQDGKKKLVINRLCYFHLWNGIKAVIDKNLFCFGNIALSSSGHFRLILCFGNGL